MKKVALLFILIFCLSASFAQNGSELITVTDMLKIKNASNIVSSKDGSKTAFTVTSIEQDEANKNDYKYLTQIYLLNNQTGKVIKLTSSKEGAGQPSWSPDAKLLAFVRTVEGKPQVFLLSMDGGEAQQLTRSKYGATNPVWSPDGKKLLFSASIPLADMIRDSIINSNKSIPAWSYEKPGFSNNSWMKTNAKPNPNGNKDEVRSYLEMNATDKKAIVLNKLNFQSETNISSEIGFGQLFLIEVDKPDQPKRITTGFYQFNNAAFTPDGKQIIFTGDIDSTQHPDRSQENEVFISNTDGTNIRVLLSQKGKSYNGSLSTSGKWLAFTIRSENDVDIARFGLMPVNGSEKDIVMLPFDREPSGFTWSANDQYLYFIVQTNGGVVLHRLDITSRKIEALSSVDEGINSFDIAGDHIIYSKTKTTNPSEVYQADLNLKNELQVSNFNDWVKTKKLSIPEKRTFTNSLGMQVEYWVMKPANYQQGKKYPLLLEIHGGPSAMWGPGVLSMWHEYQYFCSKGYGVVYSNPRGSGGYGKDLLRGNIKDWGTGPASDVLTSLDKTVAEGWADTSKLLITGGSYAGYLTAWIIAHDKRFKAACSQRGVYDLATFFGEGNAWRLVPNYFGGYPWQQEVKNLLAKESPITYVQNITTPYIIFHGGNDRRTGFVQGEMMYRSLKVLNRPVEYVVHPGASHEITRSGDNRQRIDQMLRTWEFFERYINR